MFSSVQTEIESEQVKRVLEAVRQGQTHRFEEIVSSYQQRLFGAMYLMLGDRQDAEDITQEAFTRAFLKLEAFQVKCSFFTWLHRIAFNLAIDMRRREKRARSVGKVSMEVASDSLKSSDESPSDYSERAEAQQKIYAALAKIDPERRSVITLRDLQGMDYAEIAEVLEIPIGTVRSRLHRARLELKELLAEYVNSDSPESHGEKKGDSRT